MRTLGSTYYRMSTTTARTYLLPSQTRNRRSHGPTLKYDCLSFSDVRRRKPLDELRSNEDLLLDYRQVELVENRGSTTAQHQWNCRLLYESYADPLLLR